MLYTRCGELKPFLDCTRNVSRRNPFLNPVATERLSRKTFLQKKIIYTWKYHNIFIETFISDETHIAVVFPWVIAVELPSSTNILLKAGVVSINPSLWRITEHNKISSKWLLGFQRWSWVFNVSTSISVARHTVCALILNLWRYPVFL